MVDEILIGPVIQRFFERAFQHLHYTMSVAMIVHQAPTAGIPNKKQNISLAVASVYQIPDVTSTTVIQRELSPLVLTACIAPHERL